MQSQLKRFGRGIIAAGVENILKLFWQKMQLLFGQYPKNPHEVKLSFGLML